jgi:AraC-like DNA-binding protein
VSEAVATTRGWRRAPAKAVEVFRSEAARRLLEESTRNIDQIAALCGFGDEERMRVTFQRKLGVAPRDYRKRFANRGLHVATVQRRLALFGSDHARMRPAPSDDQRPVYDPATPGL